MKNYGVTSSNCASSWPISKNDTHMYINIKKKKRQSYLEYPAIKFDSKPTARSLKRCNSVLVLHTHYTHRTHARKKRILNEKKNIQKDREREKTMHRFFKGRFHLFESGCFAGRWLLSWRPVGVDPTSFKDFRAYGILLNFISHPLFPPLVIYACILAFESLLIASI